MPRPGRVRGDGAAGPAGVVTARYPNDRSSVGAARTLVTGALADPALVLHRDVVDSAVLIISELVTNALNTGSPEIGVTVRTTRVGTVRLEVDDTGPGRPRLTRPTSDSPRGRGLAIVERLADRWGCDAAEPSDERSARRHKSVWAEVSVAR